MAAPPSPRAQTGGGDAPISVFLDTDLGSRLALLVAPDTTIGRLKSQVAAEHAAAFPDIGPVSVKSIQVNRKGALYHLSESMRVTSAFRRVKAECFLHVKMVEATEAMRFCQGTPEIDGRRTSEGQVGIHVDKHIREVPAVTLEVANDGLTHRLGGGDATAVLNNVHAHDAVPDHALLPPSSQLDTETKNESGLARDADINKSSKQTNISHIVMADAKEDISHGDQNCDFDGDESDNNQIKMDDILGQAHHGDDISQGKEHKKAKRTDSVDMSPTYPRITNKPDTMDINKSITAPMETNPTHGEHSNTSFGQEVNDNIPDDSSLIKTTGTVGKKKKRKRCQLTPSESVFGQEATKLPTGVVGLSKSGTDAHEVDLTNRDGSKATSSVSFLSSEPNDESQGGKHVQFVNNAQTSTSEQGNFDHVHNGDRNPFIGHGIISTAEVQARGEAIAEGSNGPWDGGEKHEETKINKCNEDGHNEDVTGTSNKETDGKNIDTLEEKPTNDNISKEKKRKKVKKVNSIDMVSMDTAADKEILGHTENAGKLEKDSTEREILHPPSVGPILDNVQQGNSNVIENPYGDGKRKKKKRRPSESSKDADPDQDQTKSSEHVTNRSSIDQMNSAPLNAKQKTKGSVEEATVSNKFVESLDIASTKKVKSVDMASMDTAVNKEILGHTENAQKPDEDYTEREILHGPSVGPISDNVQQGNSNVTENPHGDGKQKKKKRRPSKSLAGDDANQDQTKSSEHGKNGSSMHHANSALLDEKQTRHGSVEGAIVGSNKFGESLDIAATNTIDEVLADLQSKDILSKESSEDLLTGQILLDSNTDALELPASTGNKVGNHAALPPKYPEAIHSDAPARSPRHKKPQGNKLNRVPAMIDSSHHSCGVPEEDAELKVSDTLRFSGKAGDLKDVSNGDIVEQDDDKAKSTKRQRKKVKKVPADETARSLDEQVNQVAREEMEGVNASMQADLFQEELPVVQKDSAILKPSSPSARKRRKERKKPLKTELQSQDSAMEHDRTADLVCCSAEQDLVSPKNSADAVEANHCILAHSDNDKINFIDHFSLGKMNDRFVSTENMQNNEDEVMEAGNRKNNTGSTEPNDLLESPLHAEKTRLTDHFGTSEVVGPPAKAENMNKEYDNVKSGKEKRKKKNKTNSKGPAADKENLDGDHQSTVIGTQNSLHPVVQKGRMGQDNGNGNNDKVIKDVSIMQQESQDASFDRTIDSQNNLLISKGNAKISKEVWKSTSQKKDHVSNIVKSFAMSPAASSDSTEGTPKIANRLRLAVRKVPKKRYEQPNAKSKEETRNVGSGAIFSGVISEESDHAMGTMGEKAALEKSSDNSSASANSGISSTAYDESDVSDDDGDLSLSQKSLRGLQISSILRGSSSYKKAKQKQTELSDDDIEIPDSQPAS